MNQTIIVEGNIADGYSFHGPFTDAESAVEWAEGERFIRDEYWMVDLLSPITEPRASRA
jgi:hypothetical protein